MQYYDKLIRQIEILCMCISSKDKIMKPDLAVVFNCEKPTIKRDLNELRSFGIDIHSTKSKGITIQGKISPNIIKQLILQYIGYNYSYSTFDKSANSLVQKFKELALPNLVSLQKCIKNKIAAVIDYDIGSGKIIRGIKIQPLKFFIADDEWRILAINNDIIKQYLVLSIVSAKETDIKFETVNSKVLDDLFIYSFKSWLGPDKIEITLILKGLWAKKYQNRILFASQEVINKTKNSVTINGTVNSLEEIASWIAGKGRGVVVIKPIELKDRVISIAKEVLWNYK